MITEKTDILEMKDVALHGYEGDLKVFFSDRKILSFWIELEKIK